MIPFRVRLQDNKPMAEVGPFLAGSVEEIDIVTNGQPDTAKVFKVRIRTELISANNLRDAISHPKSKLGQRRYFYRICADNLDSISRRYLNRRKTKKLLAVTKDILGEQCKSETVTVDGMLGCALCKFDSETRKQIVYIAALTLAGLPQDANQFYDFETRHLGKDLATFIKSKRPEGPWLNGTNKEPEKLTV